LEQVLRGVAGAVTAITGFEKGSGKTAFLSLALPHARQAGPVALFTIGSDGASGPAKRSRSAGIRVEPGDVVLTTEPLARASESRFEILHTVPGRVALGRLVLGRARRGGCVTLVGAEHFSALSQAMTLIRAEGWAASALIDGAVARMTQIAALPGWAPPGPESTRSAGRLQFAFAVRADRGNLARVAARIRLLDRLADLPLDDGRDPEVLRLEGPLTSEGLRALPQGTAAFSLEDFTKVFVEPPEFLRALEARRVLVRRTFHLLCFAVILRDLSRQAFLEALGPHGAPRILFNPYEAA
jgi:hypothetical protein